VADPTGNAILSAAVGPEPPEELEKLTDVMQGYLDGHPAEDPAVNPLMADLSGLPPMLVQAATGDLILPDARALVDRAVEHGVAAQLEVYPADTHVFHVFWSFLPEAADALQRAAGFARERLADHAAAGSSRAG
jgi:acetyl esterase/lipase